jgi:hypothetical protein
MSHTPGGPEAVFGRGGCGGTGEDDCRYLGDMLQNSIRTWRLEEQAAQWVVSLGSVWPQACVVLPTPGSQMCGGSSTRVCRLVPRPLAIVTVCRHLNEHFEQRWAMCGVRRCAQGGVREQAVGWGCGLVVMVVVGKAERREKGGRQRCRRDRAAPLLHCSTVPLFLCTSTPHPQGNLAWGRHPASRLHNSRAQLHRPSIAIPNLLHSAADHHDLQCAVP